MEKLFEQLTSIEQISLKLRKLYGSFGYKKFNMSKFEEYSLYLENKNFLKSDGIITFNDMDGRLLALKPDVTLSIAKNVNTKNGEFNKLYYVENVYRLDKKTGKYREINQIGLEALGEIDAFTTTEVLSLALKSLLLIGKNCLLDVSNVGFVTSLIDSICNENFKLKNKVTEYVKAKNLHDLRLLLQENKISLKDYEKLEALVSMDGDFEKNIAKAEQLVENQDMQNAIDELKEVFSYLKLQNLEDKVRLDFSIINDEDYYNGIVFQGYIAGVPNIVLSGGRYDKLLKKLKKNAGALGFALYTDEILTYLNKNSKADVDVVVLYSEKTDYSSLINFVESLRNEGKSVRIEKVLPKEYTYAKILSFSENISEVKND